LYNTKNFKENLVVQYVPFVKIVSVGATRQLAGSERLSAIF